MARPPYDVAVRLLLGSVLLLSGCLVHEARVEPASGVRGGVHATGHSVGPNGPATEQHGPLPQEILADWMIADQGKVLLAAHVCCRTDLPWWQRFPVDLATDLWPGDLIVSAHAIVTPVPVPVRSEADLVAEARAHGYAR